MKGLITYKVTNFPETETKRGTYLEVFRDESREQSIAEYL